VDVTAIDARLSFDCRVHVAQGDTTMRFVVGADGSAQPGSDRSPARENTVFDLRQDINQAWLDGDAYDVSALAERDGSGVRPMPAGLSDGEHELRLVYDLDVPRAADSLAMGWTSNTPGIVFDFWMSDLHPGRYLEAWIPAPLCHDRFALHVELEIDGTAEPHAVFANGAQGSNGITYPPSFTSLSPMLVVAPEPRVELVDAGGITVFKLAGPEVDLGACHSTIRECLDHNRDTFGDYLFGDTFLAYIWGTTRGMEYDGATSSSVGALEHEVFHSWFGRGIKPATANDGWIDEAFTTWYTSAPPRPRQWSQSLDVAEPPVVLRPPGEFDRFTPREAYTVGARLFAGIADVLGGPDALVAAMASLYASHAGGFLSTDALQASLSGAAGVDLGWAFDRWVHGKDVRP
jgi:hypothetical protein